ncbi:MAG: phosphopantetheine adenylyltransferase [Nitrososphaerota archaeon]|nr:phosphopantetheine adenylyltransferase [Aigarchaeota archaeon]MDW8077080.1 phosphopantetheine adenylyltransferase [Nitrososphaerota archaeon]
MRRDYAKNPLWKILVDTVRNMSLYPVHKSYVRDKILMNEPSISAEELSVRLGIPLGEAMVILDELRMYAVDFEEELKSPLPVERKYNRVCLGGTFDIVHYGHLALFLTAFRSGKKVIVGVTSDELAKKLGKTHEVKPYNERMSNLKKVLEKYGWINDAIIIKLEDPYGPSVTDATLEAIVVSPFTTFRALEINNIRTESLMKPLDIIECPLILAEDGKPISSSRIIRGEITPEGRLIRP